MGDVVIVGRAALVYDPADSSTAALDDDGFETRLAASAFERIERFADVFACLEHDESKKLATAGEGGLRLWADGRGLLFEIANPDPKFATPQLLADIQRGLVGASISFRRDRGRTYESDANGV